MLNKKFSSEEIREKFLKFFETREHQIITSASLVPKNDSSVLFNTAGMQPLIPYLLGEKHPQGKRLVGVQKCLRTVDIDEVGDKTHFTFFEMLGNWSLGDYFKEDAVRWSYEFLTDKKEGLGLDPERLYVTVFAGNEDASKDTDTYKIWERIIGKDKIFLIEDDNWWDIGDNGPAGSSSEMFYDLTRSGLGIISKEEFLEADKRQDLVEIWNDVFMEYEKKNGQVIGKLANKNIDTGAGLERLAAILQNVDSPYETDLFIDSILFLEENSDKIYVKSKKDFRIIADHLRASIFLIVDDISPNNKDQGYVLRRLLRRSLIKMNNINFSSQNIPKLVEIIINKYKNIYTELEKNKEKIKQEILIEISNFEKTLEKGMKEFKKIINSEIKNNHIKKLDFGMCETSGCALNEISGEDAFKLFSTYGFPIELIKEEAEKRCMVVEEEHFWEILKNHQKKSQTAAVGKFKGGPSGDSLKIKAVFKYKKNLI